VLDRLRDVRAARACWRSATIADVATRWDSSMGEIFQRMVEIFRLGLMLQIGLATLLGGASARARARRQTGRTQNQHLICIGSVLYTHLSLAMLTAVQGRFRRHRPTRVAAQIVTGVGFIGAGTILHGARRGRRLTSRCDDLGRRRDRAWARGL